MPPAAGRRHRRFQFASGWGESTPDKSALVTPDRLAFAFYTVAVAAAITGQVWVGLKHVPWPAELEIGWLVAMLLPIAMCLELFGVATSALADARQRKGERAYDYRALSMCAAVLAVGLIVIGHWGDLIPMVALGGLSAMGYVLWLRHQATRRRDALRSDPREKLDRIAPTYGVVRWVTHPVRTSRARSVAREFNLGLYDSWRRAEEELTAEKRRRLLAREIAALIREETGKGRRARVAMKTYNMDELAVRIEARADYDGWADTITTSLAPPAAPAGAAWPRPEPTDHETEADREIVPDTPAGLTDRWLADPAAVAAAAQPGLPSAPPAQSPAIAGAGEPETVSRVNGWTLAPAPRAQTTPPATRPATDAALALADPALVGDVSTHGAERPLKVQVFSLLDAEVVAGDPRGTQQLAEWVVEQLGGKVDTAKRYVRDWKTAVAAGHRPQAQVKRLRVVPSQSG